MANESLTPKREKFVLCVAAGLSQRQAYKEAFSCKRMSDEAIDVAASRLMRDAKVSLRYEELRARIVQEAEEEAIITAKEVLEEISSIARDDISNYLDFLTDEHGEIQVRVKDSAKINTKNIAEVQLGNNGQFKFKMYGRDTALYKLADILGLIGGAGAGLADTGDDGRRAASRLTTEELKALAKRIPRK